MALYMYQAAYTAESMAAQINEPQDRIEAVRPALEAMGARSSRAATRSASLTCLSSMRQLMTRRLPASRWRLPPAVRSSRPRPPGCSMVRSGSSPCARRTVLSTSRRDKGGWSATGGHPVGAGPLSTSRDQAIFVDRATGEPRPAVLDEPRCAGTPDAVPGWRAGRAAGLRRLEDATLPGRDDVQSQLDALTAGHDVDDELAQMKAQLAASAAPQAVEGPGTASADPGRVARDVPAGRAGQRAALGDAVPAGTPKCLPRVRSRSFGTVICYGCPSSTGHACR